jgi:hypothetical protein
MALSTLLVNQIGPRAGQTKVVIADDLDLNGNDIVSAGTVTATTLDGPVATTLVKGLMSNGDKSKLNAIEAQADVTDAVNVAAAGALMESDFEAVGTPTTGVLYKTTDVNGGVSYTIANDIPKQSTLGNSAGKIYTDGQGNFSIDSTTYLTTNQAVTLSGDASGTGGTAITVTLSAGAVSGKPATTSYDSENDRLLIAKYVAGQYVLNSIAPKNLGTGSSGGGATSMTGDLTNTSLVNGLMSVQIVPAFFNRLDSLDDADMTLNNTYVGGFDSVEQKLYKMSLNEIKDFLSNYISGGSGGGTTNIIGGLVSAYIQVTDGHLIIEHSGAFTSNNFYIQNTDNHLLLIS